VAYEEKGDGKSSTVVIYYHGMGITPRPSKVLLEKGAHIVAPTIPVII
jgi:hypothetical protein